MATPFKVNNYDNSPKKPSYCIIQNHFNSFHKILKCTRLFLSSVCLFLFHFFSSLKLRNRAFFFCIFSVFETFEMHVSNVVWCTFVFMLRLSQRLISVWFLIFLLCPYGWRFQNEIVLLIFQCFCCSRKPIFVLFALMLLDCRIAHTFNKFDKITNQKEKKDEKKQTRARQRGVYKQIKKKKVYTFTECASQSQKHYNRINSSILFRYFFSCALYLNINCSPLQWWKKNIYGWMGKEKQNASTHIHSN